MSVCTYFLNFCLFTTFEVEKKFYAHVFRPSLMTSFSIFISPLNIVQYKCCFIKFLHTKYILNVFFWRIFNEKCLYVPNWLTIHLVCSITKFCSIDKTSCESPVTMENFRYHENPIQNALNFSL